jgi:hypothetical protein
MRNMLGRFWEYVSIAESWKPFTERKSPSVFSSPLQVGHSSQRFARVNNDGHGLLSQPDVTPLNIVRQDFHQLSLFPGGARPVSQFCRAAREIVCSNRASSGGAS